MRMAAFLLGGIAGAAAAIYVTRNKPVLMTNWGQAGTAMNKWMDIAKSTWKDIAAKRKTNAMTDTQAKDVSLDNVRDLVNEDTRVKAQVNEILAGNK